MKKLLSLCLLSAWCFFGSASIAMAQSPSPADPAVLPEIATLSASNAATMSGTVASTAATVEQRIQSDLTESSSTQKSKLAALLDENPLGPLSWNNFLGHSIRFAANQGVPVNVLVLLIMFPLIASVIAASRHIIGLRGFGIYTPAVLSVAFVSTGIVSGLLTFLAVLLATLGAKKILKYLELQYLPRTALLLWIVSVVVLLLMVVASYFNMTSFLILNIFPLLIIVLLSENFLETQLTSSLSDAIELTIETLAVAILCSLLISSEYLQQVVLLHPELTLLSVAIIDIVIGKYSGLRLLEYIRFRQLLDK